jgi:hypothetical protein
MLLEVRREIIPIGRISPWEQRPYSQLVWKHDGTAHVFPVTVPPDYVPGLLIAYLDGLKVSIPVFDAALNMVGCSRREIEQTLDAAPPTRG